MSIPAASALPLPMVDQLPGLVPGRPWMGRGVSVLRWTLGVSRGSPRPDPGPVSNSKCSGDSLLILEAALRGDCTTASQEDGLRVLVTQAVICPLPPCPPQAQFSPTSQAAPEGSGVPQGHYNIPVEGGAPALGHQPSVLTCSAGQALSVGIGRLREALMASRCP